MSYFPRLGMTRKIVDLTIKRMTPKWEWTRQATTSNPPHPLYTYHSTLHSCRATNKAMSDPVVVAMGDEKLKDIEGTEEKPLDVAAEAVDNPDTAIPTDEDTDATPISPVSPKPTQNVSLDHRSTLMIRSILLLSNRNTCPPTQRMSCTAQTLLPLLSSRPSAISSRH